MTNIIAAILGLMILALLAADRFWLHWGLPVRVGREFVHLVEWVSFWR